MPRLSDADLVALFYEAAADEAMWPQAVRALMAQFGACSGLFYTEGPGGLGLLQTPEWSSEALRLYAERYHALDPYARIGAASRTAWVRLGQDMVDTRAFLQSEMWHDFGRTHCNGALHVMCATAQLDPNSGLRMGLHRAKDDAEFSVRDRQYLGSLLPHLSRAVQLRNRLRQHQDISANQRATLDAISMGLVVMDGESRVILANAAAASLRVDGKPILGRAQSGFALRSQAESRLLAALVADVAADGSGGTMRVTREQGPGLLLMVSRLPRTVADAMLHEAHARHMVLITIRDLADTRLGGVDLQQLFGLTAAEADLARGLAQGRTAAALAAERGRSVLTVRVQIRAILDKTGAANLRDLAGMLASLRT